ncbi:hypothetical protein [Citrobacter pasteurii]|nr:hypothetical protein SF123566_3805 [Shigella flexneri 1235-66]CEJ63962.1 hypothetical protein [Citrobacter pasteurii]
MAGEGVEPSSGNVAGPDADAKASYQADKLVYSLKRGVF